MPVTLYLAIPCYNEEEVLPETARRLAGKFAMLLAAGTITAGSRICFIDDGSKDSTWAIIDRLHRENPLFSGIKLSRNRGHQNALLCGLMTLRSRADCVISMDADLQDDIDAIDAMLEKFQGGIDVVYGVRAQRETDTAFKRVTAQGFYRVMKALGAEVVFNHADYRLISSKVLKELQNFKEVNIFLRGMIPLVGFKSTSVYYERHERIAGESHYPLSKMLALAFNGITSLSVKPLRMIITLGFLISILSFIGVIWSVVVSLMGNSVAGWASIVSMVCFIGGIQLLCLGVIGEYIGKIYLEVKARPRYIISDRTESEEQEKESR